MGTLTKAMPKPTAVVKPNTKVETKPNKKYTGTSNVKNQLSIKAEQAEKKNEELGLIQRIQNLSDEQLKHYLQSPSNVRESVDIEDVQNWDRKTCREFQKEVKKEIKRRGKR